VERKTQTSSMIEARERGRQACPAAMLLLSTLVAASPAIANQPYLVKDINPTGFSGPIFLTKVGNRLYFNADDGVHGQELWVSDGTEEGTYMVSYLMNGRRSDFFSRQYAFFDFIAVLWHENCSSFLGLYNG